MTDSATTMGDSATTTGGSTTTMGDSTTIMGDSASTMEFQWEIQLPLFDSITTMRNSGSSCCHNKDRELWLLVGSNRWNRIFSKQNEPVEPNRLLMNRLWTEPWAANQKYEPNRIEPLAWCILLNTRVGPLFPTPGNYDRNKNI